jgi:molybdopterin-guanine dinucleotide biosynthesis protein A
MLQRVVRLLTQAVEPTSLVIVAAKDQELPSLPRLVTVVRDERPHRGPLEGLAGGLRGLPAKLDAVYCTSCDVPLLVPAFVVRMFALLEDFEISVPVDGEFTHPLAAVYRPRLLPVIERLLAKDQLRPRDLFDIVPTRQVPVDQLRSVDPNLMTLMNVNSPSEYQQALTFPLD